MFTYPSIHQPSILPSIHLPSIHPSIHPPIFHPSMYLSINPGPRGKSQSPKGGRQRKNPSAFPAKAPSALRPLRGPAATGLLRARAALRLSLWSLEGSALLRRSGHPGRVLGRQPRTLTRVPAEQHRAPLASRAAAAPHRAGKRSMGLRRQNAPDSPKEPGWHLARKAGRFPFDVLGFSQGRWWRAGDVSSHLPSRNEGSPCCLGFGKAATTQQCSVRKDCTDNPGLRGENTCCILSQAYLGSLKNRPETRSLPVEAWNSREREPGGWDPGVNDCSLWCIPPEAPWNLGKVAAEDWKGTWK